MWTCPKCERTFEKTGQMHSCRKISLEEHFKNKEKAKEIFDYLFETVNQEIGKCKIISLPCCIHLFGNYDFLAALPKKDSLEIRFSLNRKLENPRVIQAVLVSAKQYKNCIEIYQKKEIDSDLIELISEAYK